MENSSWSGKIALRRGSQMRVHRRWCKITPQSIEIFKDKNLSDKETEIDRPQINEIQAPSFDFMKSLFEGYSGYTVEYTDKEGQAQEISFWPTGFGMSVNNKALKDFGTALGSIYPEKKESLIEIDKSMSTQRLIFLLVVPFVLCSGFLCGWLNILVLFLGATLSYKVYKRKDLSQNKKILFIIGIMAMAIALVILMQIAVISSGLYSD